MSDTLYDEIKALREKIMDKYGIVHFSSFDCAKEIDAILSHHAHFDHDPTLQSKHDKNRDNLD